MSRLRDWRRVLNMVEEEQAAGLSARAANKDAEADDRSFQAHARRTHRVTPSMIDEAVDAAINERGTPPGTAEIFRNLLSTDSAATVLQSYHATASSYRRAQCLTTARQRANVRYSLNEEQVRQLAGYAPEFEFTFRDPQLHDHPMAAMTRIVDHKLLMANLPRGVEFTDVGGNPLTYVRAGIDGVHVCGPDLDAKDPARHAMRLLQAKKLARETTDTRVKAMATEYVGGAASFVCNRRAQDCHHRSDVLLSVHVYDVPMTDWPKIMHSKGALAVEGCMIFSPRFFEDKVGTLSMSGAQYEIDVAKNEFRMTFEGSSSWGYRHNLVEFLRYGTDQVMKGPDAAYAYKIVQRRGDTIFFRILRADTAVELPERVYRSPSLPMVRVNGHRFDGTKSFKKLVPCVYYFPKMLWNDMVEQAAQDFERGALDYTKMYNQYRAMSSRQTVNGVLISGGVKVPYEDLMPFVVHACLAAAASVLLGRKETFAITDAAQRERTVGSSAWANFLGFLQDSFRGMANAANVFGLIFGKALDKLTVAELQQHVATWAPQPEIRNIPAENFLVDVPGDFDVWEAQHLFVAAGRQAAFSDAIAAIATHKAMAERFLEVVPNARAQVESVTAVESVADHADVPAKPMQATVETDDEESDEHPIRIEAIKECIVEAELQNNAIADLCTRAFNEIGAGTRIDPKFLKSRVDVYGSPDLWRVRNGIISESALGMPVKDFSHMAVYYVGPGGPRGICIHAVKRVRGKGADLTHQVISDAFNGWVMTCDALLVFNGPDVIASLQKALGVRHDYSITAHEGPPGCGKTYRIVRSAEVGPDAIMCPVRESIDDTRAEYVKYKGEVPDAKLRIRTLDSYLVRHGQDERTQQLTARSLYVDECFMVHSGRIYAAAGLLRARAVYAFGDSKQIPHVPRVECPKLHVRLRAESTTMEWLVRRCPATAIAAWGHLYDFGVRSENKYPNNMRVVIGGGAQDVPSGSVALLCMYQSGKVDLRKLYHRALQRKDVFLMTVHESQGKTYDHVILHRFDARKRTDRHSLYDQPEYSLVALSRHRKQFVYVVPADLGDLPIQWVRKSADVRRVKAAADLASAGQSVEFAT